MSALYGIDLGTSNIKIFNQAKDLVLNEKNVIAMVKGSGDVIAIGDEAFEMYEKAPENIEVIFPMQKGVIANIKSMQKLLHCFLKKMSGMQIKGADYVVAVPTDITEVEKKAFYNLVMDSEVKAREVKIVDKAVADAVGLSVNVNEPKGIMVVNIGGDTTEISVLSLGGIVNSRLLKIGGTQFDESICNIIRKKHNLVIGTRTAERLKKKIAYASGLEEVTMPAFGRNLVTGLPQKVEISSELVHDAIKESLSLIVDAAKVILERTPPELSADIIDSGIYITGGGSQIHNMDKLVTEETELKVRTCERPEESVVRGLCKLVEDEELKHLAYSMKETSYR